MRLPVQLQRAMAAEAEAAREARAKVIAAEGEQKASHALKEAASVIQESPSALQVPLFVLIFWCYDVAYLQRVANFKVSLKKVWKFSNYKREQRFKKLENLRILKR